MKFKKVILLLIAILIVVGIGVAIVLGGKKNEEKSDDKKIKVVSSNFASYDFLRAIIGDNKKIELSFLLGPGKEAHSYDPTAKDLIKIQDADLFVYIGGEMEQWSDKVLASLDSNNKEIVCIADFVDTIEEKEVDGAEEEEEDEDDDDEGAEHEHEHEHEEGAFDEHIWTSPN